MPQILPVSSQLVLTGLDGEGVTVGVTDGVRLGLKPVEGVTLGVTLIVALTLGVGNTGCSPGEIEMLGVMLGVTLALGVTLGVTLTLVLGVTLGVTLGVLEILGSGVTLGSGTHPSLLQHSSRVGQPLKSSHSGQKFVDMVMDGVIEGDGDTLIEGDALGVTLGEGVRLGETDMLGVTDGVTLIEAAMLGVMLGVTEAGGVGKRPPTLGCGPGGTRFGIDELGVGVGLITGLTAGGTL
jgi:hypothetical protein